MMLGRIYIIRNSVNDKVYIGKTVKSIKRRFNEHKSDARCKALSKIHIAMKDIGVENFSIAELEVVDTQELSAKERFYIALYNSFERGYNSTCGGEAGEKVSKSIREGIYDLHRDGVSNNQIAQYYSLNRATVRWILAENGVNIDATPGKPLVQYNRQYIKIANYNSVRSACKALGVGNLGNFNHRVGMACKNGTIAYNSYWQVAETIFVDGIWFKTIDDVERYKSGYEYTLDIDGMAICKDYLKYRRRVITEDKKYCNNSYKGRQVPVSEIRLYPPTLEYLQNMYPKYTANSIANHLGVSYTTINKYLKRFSLK